MSKVLLTQGELKQTLAITRELGRYGHEVEVISMGLRSIHGLAVAAFSKYCKRHHKVSTYSDEQLFIGELIGILKKRSFDFLIPVGAPFVEWVTKNREEIEVYAKIPFPDSRIIQQYEDKKFSAGVAVQLGISVPQTLYPSSLNEMTKISSSLKYPVVIKAIKEVGGNIVDYAKNEGELIAKYRKVVEKHKLQSDLPMIQEFLTGKGVGFFALYNNGKCLQTFQHKRIREFPVSGGASCCAMSVYDKQIDVWGRKMLDYATWTGVAMVEFKYNAEGIPCFLEVNPKFWGSYDLSVASGVNFTHKLLSSLSGKSIKENEPYKINLIFSWPYSGDIQHCLQRRELLSLWRGVLSRKIITNTTGDDWKGNMAIRANWILDRTYALYLKIKKIFK